MINAKKARELLESKKLEYATLITSLATEAIPNAFDAVIKQATEDLKGYFSAGQIYSKICDLYPELARKIDARDVLPMIKDVAERNGFKYEHNEDEKKTFFSDDIVF